MTTTDTKAYEITYECVDTYPTMRTVAHCPDDESYDSSSDALDAFAAVPFVCNGSYLAKLWCDGKVQQTRRTSVDQLQPYI